MLADQNNRDAIRDRLDVNMLVEAAAGTGKTTCLIRRMVALLASGKALAQQIVAVTFTREAASEIRARFHIELHKAAAEEQGTTRQRLLRAVQHSHRCFIGTIHAFCGRLLRERPVEAGVDASFVELDETADSQLRQLAWKQHVDQLLRSDHQILRDLEEVGLRVASNTNWNAGIVSELEQLGLEFAQLGPAFLRMAEFPDVNVWATAAPRNKPDVQEGRAELIAFLDAIEPLIPLIEAIDKRDELMKRYLRLSRMRSYLDLQRLPELMELLAQFSTRDNKFIVQKRWPEGPKQAKAELARWNRYSTEYAEPLSQAWREYRHEPVIRALQSGIEHYHNERRRTNRLNFQDLLLRAAGMLRSQPAARLHFREQYSHLLIDEFQDTDPLQAEVMLLLTATNHAEPNWRACRPVPGSLFVVGDPKQSIYRFRRADIRTFNTVKQLIESQGGVTLSLTANFRALRPVVDWVNEVFATQFPEKASHYEPQRADLETAREGSSSGPFCGVFTLPIPLAADNTTTQRREAVAIAELIQQAVRDKLPIPRTQSELAVGLPDSVQAGDFMILTRTRFHLATYAEALEQRGIDCDVSGGDSLNQSAELQLLLKCMRCVSRPDDELALLALLRSELFGVSDVTLFRLRECGGPVLRFNVPLPQQLHPQDHKLLTGIFQRLGAYRQWISRHSPPLAVAMICDDLGLTTRSSVLGDATSSVAGLLKAMELLSIKQADLLTSGDLVRYLEQLASKAERHDHLPVRRASESAVRILNLHKAKGLESPIVILADPTGAKRRRDPITLHIDRSDEPVGHLAVYGKKISEFGGRPCLAEPPEWSSWRDEEQRYLDHEVKRLMYVAATRAGGCGLIVTRPSSGKGNAWSTLTPFLLNKPSLELQGDSGMPEPAALAEVTSEAMHDGVQQRRAQREQATTPSYSTKTATEWRRPETQAKVAKSASRGPQWGELVHELLKDAANEISELLPRATNIVARLELPLEWADEAVDCVRRVTSGSTWQRAQASDRCWSEVPLSVQIGGELVHGVIDLIFYESDSWVIVDFKTETVEQEHHPALLDSYRHQLQAYRDLWEHATGERVKETGLLLTASGHYLTT